MTKRVLFISFLLGIFSSLFSQKIAFHKPRDTTYNFRGKVKQALLYEYRISDTDTSKFNSKLEANSNPSYSYHFNEKKMMTEMISYQADSILKITNFLYDEKENLIYELTRHPKAIDGKNGIFKIGQVLGSYDSSFHNFYHFFEGVKTPQFTKGVQMKRYVYDTLKRTIHIVENNMKPAAKLIIDDKNRVLVHEHFRNFYSHKTTKFYDNENMVKERNESRRGVFIKNIEYDSSNRVIKQSHFYPDSSKNRVIKFQYIGMDSIFSTTLDYKNKILSKNLEFTFANKTIAISEKKEKLEYEPFYGEVRFKDDYGNIYKRYKVDFVKGQTYVKEYHYTFY